VFRILDTNADGELTGEELSSGLRAERGQADGNGRISKDEYRDYFKRKVEKKTETVPNAFQASQKALGGFNWETLERPGASGLPGWFSKFDADMWSRSSPAGRRSWFTTRTTPAATKRRRASSSTSRRSTTASADTRLWGTCPQTSTSERITKPTAKRCPRSVGNSTMADPQGVVGGACGRVELLRQSGGSDGRPTYEANGWHIGSGAVESACKTVVGQRLKGSGMRWSEVGAHAVCHVHALYRSEHSQWTDFWRRSTAA
jgi:hypothetical protein